MECRIESKSEASRTVVAITGRLSGHVVEELRGVRRSIEGVVTLDLASLVSADEEGFERYRDTGNPKALAPSCEPSRKWLSRLSA